MSALDTLTSVLILALPALLVALGVLTVRYLAIVEKGRKR